MSTHVTLEILANPGELPYRARLIDATDRTIAANFTLDLERLRQLTNDLPEVYGGYLYDQVFRHSVDSNEEPGKLERRLRVLLRHAQDDGAGRLRLKLEIATNLPGLHGLAWESLFDNQEELALATDHRIILYRDLDVDSPLREPAPAPPRVLIAIVSPSATALAQLNSVYGWDLEPIAVAAEEERLRLLFESLRPHLLYDVLPLQDDGQRTWDHVTAAMDDGGFHVLHLSCHGVFHQGNNCAYIIFTKDNGQPDLISAGMFRNELRGRGDLRLVLLDACRTAESSHLSAFSSMASRLMEAVPAAIGMQRTWYTGVADDRFTRAFYRDLARHGYVDRALQRARRDLRRWQRERWEWGTPVLFLRLSDGRLFVPQPSTLAAGDTERDRQPMVGSRTRAGVRIGPGARLNDVNFEGDFAGGNIVEVEGNSLPERDAAPGTGIDIGEGAIVERSQFRGDFAGGGIYRQRLARQALTDYGPAKQIAAHQALIAYYERRLEALHTRAEVDQRQATELADLEAQIAKLVEEVEALVDAL